ncbi:branched-chain amino acid ABC transporter permease [Candidatus Formimonas warabiya]|uniref:Branched-chain amino acid ABC transporter permease n=1 Tax=Formimonas warabiya TaxID=1761012 RepID=A0A3G1L2L9_FORW1|nr:branched-chain amino acid ABC transporter permease [Candidatus Formimonas warabiya]ATW28715.1 branched-chain amino acid ABC transporter permease [Candidatus Formimonas warabiya]
MTDKQKEPSFWKRHAPVIILAVVLLAVYLIFYFWIDGFNLGGTKYKLNKYYTLNLYLMGMNIILAVSLNLVCGITGQLALGHAGFMAVGAYISAIFTMKLGLPFPVAILAGGLAAAVMGVIIGLPTLRLKGDYLAIATLGMGEIIRVILININYVGGASGLSPIPKLTNWTWIFFLTVGTILFAKNFINSTHGRACISVREDEIAAETMGINSTRYKTMAFCLGAFFAGVAGAVYAHNFYIIQPNVFNFFKSFEYLVMVVLGGLGSLTGTVLAASGLTVVNVALQRVPELRMILYSLVLIVVMLFRPSGLMGRKEFTFSFLKSDKERGGQRGTSGN